MAHVQVKQQRVCYASLSYFHWVLTSRNMPIIWNKLWSLYILYCIYTVPRLCQFIRKLGVTIRNKVYNSDMAYGVQTTGCLVSLGTDNHENICVKQMCIHISITIKSPKHCEKTKVENFHWRISKVYRIWPLFFCTWRLMSDFYVTVF